MGQIIRCPLVGTPCMRPITIEEKTFFLAEAEEPEYDKKHRKKAINEAIADGYKIRSALEEKGINAFTCKICEMMQTCAYGMADISQNNSNVFMELGMMLALGKPTIILAKKGQEQQLKLPSDVIAIEVIPFDEYLDIIEQLRKAVEKLPSIVSPPSPIQDLEKVQPQFAKELRKIRTDIVEEFKKSIEEAKLDTILPREEKKEISPELSERIGKLEGTLKDLMGLGFTTDATTAFLRGNFYYNQGKYNDALTTYNWSLELEPDDPSILNNRGITYDELRRYNEALADYNRSLELRPNHPRTLMNRGVTYDSLGRHDDALADYNRSLELRPDHPDTLMNRGVIYRHLERYDDALADYNRSLELRPDHPVTLMNRGVTYAHMERYDDALTDYNRSLELRPDDPDTLMNRGTTYAHMERYDDALADFNHSLELRPDDPDTLTNRGVTYRHLERYDDALADFNRSLELKPDDPDTLYDLACLSSLWGKVDDALTYLEKAINKDKKYREMARTDKDFDNIRDDPRFKKLIESD